MGDMSPNGIARHGNRPIQDGAITSLINAR